METTLKIVLDRRRAKRNNTFPLRMRVYQGRDYKTHSLGIDLRESDLNVQTQQVKSCNPNHKLYNVQINSLKTKVQKSIFIKEGEKELTAPNELLNQVVNIEQRKQVTKQDILAYGRQHIKKLQTSGQIGNSIVYNVRINNLEGYAKTTSLAFEEVTYAYIEQFHTALLAEGMKVNDISNYLRTIRALFNKAIKEGTISAERIGVFKELNCRGIRA